MEGSSTAAANEPVSASKIRVFTSAAVNYLPKVRLLCESIRKHHPEFTLHWVMVDRAPDWLDLSAEPIDGVIGMEDLGIENWEGWAFQHSLVELCTAVKPFAIRRLFSQPDTAAVLYFDPDMVLFSRLDDMLAELAAASVLLTPHQTTPEKHLEAVMDNEMASLAHGVFNLGYIGVKNDAEGRRFNDWWAARLYYFCRAAPELHLFTDQKWINFAPIFFDRVRILKSPRYNVATWNLTTRQMTEPTAGQFAIDGEPMGFYHFTGFDSGAHKVMARKYVGDNRAVMNLIQWYEDECARRSDARLEGSAWGFARFSNGEAITALHRVIYRLRADLRAAFPSPFALPEDSNSYFDWFRLQAKIEYPHLFVESTAPEDYRSTLATGHPALPRRLDWRRVRALAWQLASQPRNPRLVKRAASILTREGIDGILRRISRPRLT